MNGYLIFRDVIAICVLLNRFAQRLPIPSLLFSLLWDVFRSNGIVGIPFDDYQISEQILFRVPALVVLWRARHEFESCQAGCR